MYSPCTGALHWCPAQVRLHLHLTSLLCCQMPDEILEITVEGQLVGASLSATSAHASYSVVLNTGWTLVAGRTCGSSHVDTPKSTGNFIFGQPISFQARGRRSAGWPTLRIEVRTVDSHGLSDVAGYGLQFVPSEPGSHMLTCPLWRPKNISKTDRLASFFLGGNPELKNPELIFGMLSSQHTESTDEEKASKQPSSRLERGVGNQRLTTTTSGKVHLMLHVCTRSSFPGKA